MISHFNYRLIDYRTLTDDPNNVMLAEVYYDTDNKLVGWVDLVPMSINVKPDELAAAVKEFNNTLEDFAYGADEIERMKTAIDKPILAAHDMVSTPTEEELPELLFDGDIEW